MILGLYPEWAVKRALTIQEAILRAQCDQCTWAQAAKAAGVSTRTLRRWRQRYDEFGYEGLLDHRLKLERDWPSSRGRQRKLKQH